MDSPYTQDELRARRMLMQRTLGALEAQGETQAQIFAREFHKEYDRIAKEVMARHSHMEDELETVLGGRNAVIELELKKEREALIDHLVKKYQGDYLDEDDMLDLGFDDRALKALGKIEQDH